LDTSHGPGGTQAEIAAGPAQLPLRDMSQRKPLAQIRAALEAAILNAKELANEAYKAGDQKTVWFAKAALAEHDRNMKKLEALEAKFGADAR
jgi:hypothetical protein